MATTVLVSLAACSQIPGASPAASPTAGAPTKAATSASTSGGSSSAGSPSPSAAPTSSAAKPSPSATKKPASGTCSSLAGELSLDEQVGQLFMAGTSSSGMSDAEAQRLASLKVGSVLLLGNSTAGKSTITAVTSSIKKGVGSDQGVKVLLAADQEGGQVQRLKGPGYDTIPSAEEQANLSDDDLESSAQQWGSQLKESGIDVDLAPVSDVVPTSVGSENQPIGALQRGYGPKPKVVASKNTAFVKGMESAGVATSVKHFPGLGVVRGNTDLEADVHDSVTTRDDKSQAGFKSGVKAGADMVMISSAVYDKIDPDHPATYSRTVLKGMVRGDLGFDGVIISDDLMGKALSNVAVSERALKFIRSGGDLAIVGQPGEVEPMVQAVRKAAAKDADLRAQIKDAAARVLIMKAKHGLADCKP